ncbi:hypothetical protein PoB_006592600 [Plakobranchus ocellatus]|uniref:Uncharacterized protein n=1 Tax=Plakobranchus ocellatus TaxID=259542 RepID=A0AAV4D657_9GAST|nr:hypothetical protein PoB_006592600 [Plakobranchus ocellatus]
MLASNVSLIGSFRPALGARGEALKVEDLMLWLVPHDESKHKGASSAEVAPSAKGSKSSASVNTAFTVTFYIGLATATLLMIK